MDPPSLSRSETSRDLQSYGGQAAMNANKCSDSRPLASIRGSFFVAFGCGYAALSSPVAL
jgi:hypothetical protein